MQIIKSYCAECGRPTHIYKRSLTGGAIHFLRNLDFLSQNSPETRSWHYKKVITKSIGQLDYSLLKDFGLIDPDPFQNGYWMINEKGKDFLEGKIAIPKFIKKKLGAIIGESKQQVFIDELGKDRFDKDALL